MNQTIVEIYTDEHPDTGEPTLGWDCPCGFKNYHNGQSNKVPNEIKENIEQEMADSLDVDPESVRSFFVPPEVWCCKCENKYQTRAEFDGFSSFEIEEN